MREEGREKGREEGREEAGKVGCIINGERGAKTAIYNIVRGCYHLQIRKYMQMYTRDSVSTVRANAVLSVHCNIFVGYS